MMKKEVYETKIIEMQNNPNTGRSTICLEIELDTSDFDEIKEHWAHNDMVDIRFLNVE